MDAIADPPGKDGASLEAASEDAEPLGRCQFRDECLEERGPTG
jgi:hypothetical protein